MASNFLMEHRTSNSRGCDATGTRGMTTARTNSGPQSHFATATGCVSTTGIASTKDKKTSAMRLGLARATVDLVGEGFELVTHFCLQLAR